MGALVAAKRFDQVLEAATRHDWLLEPTAQGRVELYQSNALVIGYGTVGRLIGERLAAFGVNVTGVTRSGAPGTIGPDDWRNRKRWDEYLSAYQDMFDRTHRPDAPWVIVPANDKRQARLQILKRAISALDW